MLYNFRKQIWKTGRVWPCFIRCASFKWLRCWLDGQKSTNTQRNTFHRALKNNCRFEVSFPSAKSSFRSWGGNSSCAVLSCVELTQRASHFDVRGWSEKFPTSTWMDTSLYVRKTKIQSKQWIAKREPAPKKAKTVFSTGDWRWWWRLYFGIVLELF